MIIIAIAFFLLHCGTAFLLRYCCDFPKLWENNEKPNIKMPSLDDLPNDMPKHEMNKYVKEIISPAYNYFCCAKRAETLVEIEDIMPYIYGSILQIPTILLLGDELIKIDFLPYNWICYIIALAVCWLGAFLTSFIYKRTNLQIDNFSITVESIKKQQRIIDYHVKKYGINEATALNNLIIDQHDRYIFRISDTLETRYVIRRTLFGLATIIYFLFFMRIPN